MFVERILYPIAALGPGNRIVVWTVGCTKQCPRCENPELWIGAEGQEISVEDLARELKRIHIAFSADEITFTGGDPLEQSDELERLLLEIRPYFTDILIYTGFTLDEAKSMLGDQRFSSLSQLIDVLIDGRYIDSCNDGVSPLRGSSNQKVIFFSNAIREKYEKYLSGERSIQNVVYNGKIISVGIHNRELIKEGPNG